MPYKRSLAECLESQGIVVSGTSNDGVKEVSESPTLDASRWSPCLDVNKERGKATVVLEPVKAEVVYRAADSDRAYSDESPTLRSLAKTNGKQAGSGAVKVREYNGTQYLERPMTAREYENLMGWESDSTAIGLTEDGKEISISQTQRKKMLGNGIIPQEITEMLTALKPIIEAIGE